MSPMPAEQVIASLVSELLAAGQILNALHHYSPMSSLLHAMADLQQRNIIEQDLLRVPERKAALSMAKNFGSTAFKKENR